jgi:hypothetical protein
VNNFRALVLFPLLAPLFAVIAASGCEKTNDVPRLQEEALAIQKTYQERLGELAQRAEVLGKRGNTLPPDAPNSADAQRSYRQAREKLEECHGNLQQVPTRVRAGTTSEELDKLIDELRERLEACVVETTSELAAVESWIGVTVQRQGAAPTAPAAPSAAAGTVPTAAPGTSDQAPDAPGSDAPIR